MKKFSDFAEERVTLGVCVAEGWVLDNRQRDIIKWDKLPYEWVKSMRMDEPGIWRKAE
jgi:predicted transglutaminase-like cysteine proteinase